MAERWQDVAAREAVLTGEKPVDPDWQDAGVPVCTDECRYHDGKRCKILGFRAPRICEPAVVSMAMMLTRRKVSNG